MKNLILFSSLFILANSLISQSYYTLWNSERGTEIVVVSIDLNRSINNISVIKEISQTENGQELDNHSLILLGEFNTTEPQIPLDYTLYNYFYVPLDPKLPFLWINKTKQVSHGYLYLNDNNTTSERGNGDITYWCTCGGHTPNSPGPGGCLSSLTDKVVNCLNTGGCALSSSCIGSAVTNSRTMIGGGILIQTSKTSISHDFRSGY